jgi:hypothetical protein
LGEEGKGKGPLAYISCKEISHAPPTSFIKSNPNSERKIQVPNPKCNKRRTNHHITRERTRQNNLAKNKMNSEMLVNETKKKRCEKEGKLLLA